MTGKTLLITRSVKNHDYYKTKLLEYGFHDVTVTSLEKDALYSLIRELKPNLIIMSARFYHGCTPFVMGELHKCFPKIKMAAVTMDEYPDEVAMYFILNGIKSYFSFFDDAELFRNGLKKIAKGGEYTSPGVLERIKLRATEIQPAGKVTGRHREVLKLICSGFKDEEIAETLGVSRNTVVNHKTSFFTSLNVRNPIELVRAALTLEMVRLEEIYFYPRKMVVNPIPEKNIKGRSRI